MGTLQKTKIIVPRTFSETAMQLIKIKGQVDGNHRLTAQVPQHLSIGEIELFVPVPDDADPDDAWMKGIVQEWAAELGDPREDIYTLEDGVAVREAE